MTSPMMTHATRPFPLGPIMGVVFWLVLASLNTLPVRAESPWARGVSAADRAEATRLHRVANDHLLEWQLPEALEAFRRALQHWDHPSIHLSLAGVEHYLGHSLEAWTSVENALRHGGGEASPLSSPRRERAFALRDQIRQRIVAIRIDCSEPDAVVEVDGRFAFKGPRTRTHWVLPGVHQIVARKPGHMIASQSIVTRAGQTAVVELSLPPLARAQGTRRWAQWKPWAVYGGGVVTGLAGATLYWRSKVDDRTYRQAMAAYCPAGCRPEELPGSISGLHGRAEAQRRASIVTGVAAGATITAGLALLYANRPRPHHLIDVQIFAPADHHGLGLGLRARF